MSKQKFKVWLIQFGIFLVQVLLSRIKMFGAVGPAGFPFVMVRIFSGHNIFLVLGEYVVSKLWCFEIASNVLIVAFE